ncbi:hypothetical protein BKH41_08545 [Helicobacter sp. 12S02232-10]|uniref:single-stranded DNA-binding protein n=1 Tax=Helicobacter sp. 12S02232-10 TaxID=1476197 RepID=UPI000BA6A07C|nr:single-stranded DNA-binding protein [Helicobacter sp. 12S02232-10]PAF46748.1 hypothetical protein BKH41_08545 [Helicobacter sp. 12S02232-10]
MTNIITISGNLVSGAELKIIGKNNVCVCNFTIANNRRFKNEKGEVIERPCFIDISLFGAYAEALHKHLTKGKGVIVTGELIQDVWENEGKKYSKHRIRAKEIDFRESKSKEEEKAQERAEREQAQNESFINIEGDQITVSI